MRENKCGKMRQYLFLFSTFVFTTKAGTKHKISTNQEPKIGSSNKSYILRRTALTCQAHKKSNYRAVATPERTKNKI